MRIVVVENKARWPLDLPGSTLVSARDYLAGEGFEERKGIRVYNFCRTYGYQTLGYYVSLLAAARGHRPIPTVETLQDLRLGPVVRIASEQLDGLIQRSLGRLRARRFEVSIYFGRNLAKRYDKLARALHAQFPAPLLRASFEKKRGTWDLVSVRPIATSEIPDSHVPFVIDQAKRHFGTRSPRTRSPRVFRYHMAILFDPNAEDTPSNQGTIRRFIRAARTAGIDAETISVDDAGSIAEYDALFIRQTTSVDHATYRIARRAEAEGLVVIDDPVSILRCTNKVFQAELFRRHGIDHPRTEIVGTDEAQGLAERLGLPCILKRPDSAFSKGVVKASTVEELAQRLEEFRADSELVIAQEFTPSDFDWRIGVLGGEALFAARYFMARGHWQIARTSKTGTQSYGRTEAVPLDEAPAGAVDVATRACRLVGDGLYGVDVKELGGRFLVMEVNDNPNLDVGFEDRALGEELYVRLMDWFRQRLDARGGPA